MKQKQVQKISNIIEQCLEKSPLGKKLKASRLIQSWEKVLGKNISEKTNKLYIYKDTLFVEVNSSVIKHHLHTLRKDIIAKLNKEVNGKIIDKIIIRNKKS